ncbi:hypothetical protein [Ovoidimarina sediminis]|nr:hypothetical protein [Rhodophyticola sp. MJ-SS7]MDU8943491.1 hypothetical protein [Rhodophyticola sp. MJ-SS7]
MAQEQQETQKVWTKEDLRAAGIPEGLRPIATWWDTLAEMKADLKE